MVETLEFSYWELTMINNAEGSNGKNGQHARTDGWVM